MKKLLQSKGLCKKKSQKGFTLVELIVVVAIIGILIAMLAPSMVAFIDNAKKTANNMNARTIYTAAQAVLTNKILAGETISVGTDGSLKATLNGADELEDLIGTIAGDFEIRGTINGITSVVYTDPSGQEGKYPQDQVASD